IVDFGWSEIGVVFHDARIGVEIDRFAGRAAFGFNMIAVKVVAVLDPPAKLDRIVRRALHGEPEGIFGLQQIMLLGGGGKRPEGKNEACNEAKGGQTGHGVSRYSFSRLLRRQEASRASLTTCRNPTSSSAEATRNCPIRKTGVPRRPSPSAWALLRRSRATILASWRVASASSRFMSKPVRSSSCRIRPSETREPSIRISAA